MKTAIVTMASVGQAEDSLSTNDSRTGPDLLAWI